jgi:hypothetical protein
MVDSNVRAQLSPSPKIWVDHDLKPTDETHQIISYGTLDWISQFHPFLFSLMLLLPLLSRWSSIATILKSEYHFLDLQSSETLSSKLRISLKNQFYNKTYNQIPIY